MADLRQSKKSNPAGAASRPQKVELDRIELPPEPPATPEADLPVEDLAPQDSPVDVKPAASADSPESERTAPPVPQTFPPLVKIFLIAIAGVAAAIWVFIGGLYFFDWLFSK